MGKLCQDFAAILQPHTMLRRRLRAQTRPLRRSQNVLLLALATTLATPIPLTRPAAPPFSLTMPAELLRNGRLLTLGPPRLSRAVPNASITTWDHVLAVPVRSRPLVFCWLLWSRRPCCEVSR